MCRVGIISGRRYLDTEDIEIKFKDEKCSEESKDDIYDESKHENEELHLQIDDENVPDADYVEYSMDRQKVKVNLSETSTIENHDKNEDNLKIAKPRPRKQAEPRSGQPSMNSQNNHNLKLNNHKKIKTPKKQIKSNIKITKKINLIV